ncbi:hypothetical protein HN873_012676, partial [Arachis hypogaea]
CETRRVGLEFLFAKHHLILARIHGQGYNRASNIQEEFNGLKSLILNLCNIVGASYK